MLSAAEGIFGDTLAAQAQIVDIEGPELWPELHLGRAVKDDITRHEYDMDAGRQAITEEQYKLCQRRIGQKMQVVYYIKYVAVPGLKCVGQQLVHELAALGFRGKTQGLHLFFQLGPGAQIAAEAVPEIDQRRCDDDLAQQKGVGMLS